MSEQTDDLLPTYEQARSVIDNYVGQRVYFAKLAALGVVPQNETEAASLWALGQKLSLLAQAQQVKQAAETDPFVHTHEALDDLLESTGIIKRAEAEQNAFENAELAFVEKLAQDPDIYNSMLSIIGSEAEASIAAAAAAAAAAQNS